MSGFRKSGRLYTKLIGERQQESEETFLDRALESTLSKLDRENGMPLNSSSSREWRNAAEWGSGG